ncbi:hypothetical protein CF319_g8436 [Tilletia indica]|nr:hypothetical protein CF319_g8436 [Tilletia indica]
MSSSAQDPPALTASLRCLERLGEEHRPAAEQAIRAQFDADQQTAQAQAAQEAEEEAERVERERAAVAAAEARRAQLLQEQEAHLAAAKHLVDLAKAQEPAPEPKDKGKKVVQDDSLGNHMDLLVATPSQKTRDKIRANDFVDLWHLTAEGMAVATKARLSGDSTFKLGQDGSFEVKDSLTGFRPDRDLPMTAWITAIGTYVRVMQAEGVAENIVQSLIRLNYTLTNHPDFEHHSTAIRMWHEHQRRQWVISGLTSADGKRFNLGIPNTKHFDSIRLRLIEDHASRRALGVPKRAFPDEPAQVIPSAPALPKSESTGRHSTSSAALPDVQSLRTVSNQSASIFSSRDVARSVVPVECTGVRTVAPLVTVPHHALHEPHFPSQQRSTTSPFQPLPTSARSASSAPSNSLPPTSPSSSISHSFSSVLSSPRSASSLPTGAVLSSTGFDEQLRRFGLLSRYPSLPSALASGFNIGIPPLHRSRLQVNHGSALAQPAVIQAAIARELAAGRYRGPFSSSELQALIGPCQSSPLGLVPKGDSDWRIIQDFSWPRDGESINSHLCSDSWPTAWGAARDVVRTLLSLPPTAQGAVRDVWEAFRRIPLHPSQWPGTVVRGLNDDFYIDMFLGFGLSPATGVWGLVADAIADLCRAQGLGPILKWVDDYLFLSVPLHALPHVNHQRRILADSIQGRQARGGVAFFAGRDGDEHVEDYAFPLQNHSANSPSALVASLSAITSITAPLGVPWKASKDVDFCPNPIYIGFQWFISERCVGLADAKRLKYLASLRLWLSQPRQGLRSAQKLFGQLQHASFVVLHGRKRLGSLRRFVASMSHAPPRIRHRPGKMVTADLRWWEAALARPTLRRSFAHDDDVVQIDASCDASTSFGVGVRIGDKELSIPVRAGWNCQGRDIAWLEAIALEVTVQLLVDQGISDCKVHILTDNSSVFFSERSGHSRNAQIMEVLARVRAMEADHNIDVIPVLVPSADNPADAPSRGVRRASALLHCPVLHPTVRPFFA